MAGSSSEQVAARMADLALAPELAAELAPLLTLLTWLAPVNAQIAAADARLAAVRATDPVVQRLTTVPGVGAVTASAFVATMDDITRFRHAHDLEAYLGLVPSERSSGEKCHRGRITKAGNTRVRWLLVEAGWRILRSRSPETAALRAGALPIAARRGKRIAVVALARRLAGILFAMWRDEAAYDPAKIRLRSHHAPPPAQEVTYRVSWWAGACAPQRERTESGRASA